ncbi:MAG: lipoyl synthase [Bacteroidetes bacterium GWF2_43_63]|nr:MAG: lipoyl synthase [Bacteroidetes bacterium GWE2_42_42]OFY55738.1 MAG: lipoyl synthase [Bacteroidetes bacterium GWF2_43_63]HBG71349.1 lipoyl synthase [Bacteroidales bacterium]HCB60431.1 lipoyl synthase [Bacteroidales bacterium]HCY22612.1 lipoyl synthase [Bacteroidales bacterium]
MIQNESNRPKAIKPKWLKSRLPSADVYSKMKSALSEGCLHTICESGKCPNIGECWAAGAATFMILGNSCTRNCRFCAVDHTRPLAPDNTEPENLATTVAHFKLRHCVITSVTRDDLKDEGAQHWADCIAAVRTKNPTVSIEVLVPDFHAKHELIKIIADAKPDIFSHNIETVRRLTPQIRSVAQYDRSLEVLRIALSMGLRVKSGIMTGLGESMEEIAETIKDIRATGCSILTVGQYLQPRHENHVVEKYYTPEEFAYIRKLALELGFSHVESGPLVRSSYHSAEAL